MDGFMLIPPKMCVEILIPVCLSLRMEPLKKNGRLEELLWVGPRFNRINDLIGRNTTELARSLHTQRKGHVRRQ